MTKWHVKEYDTVVCTNVFVFCVLPVVALVLAVFADFLY